MKRSERSDAEIQLSKQVVQTFLKYLRLASKNKILVNFGYMGSGLIETSKKCTYLAETVEIGEEFGKVFVLARRDET